MTLKQAFGRVTPQYAIMSEAKQEVKQEESNIA